MRVLAIALAVALLGLPSLMGLAMFLTPKLLAATGALITARLLFLIWLSSAERRLSLNRFYAL